MVHIRETRLGRKEGPHAKQILILVCDTPVDKVFADYGSYHDIFCQLFERSMAIEPKTEEAVRFLGYDVVKEEYPSEDTLKNSDAVLITGSAASAYEPKAWITRLVHFTSSLPPSYPNLKIIGICFGHQIVSLAFGGKVIKNPKGWELGVRKLQLTAVGKRILARANEDTKPIEQVHQDHASEAPEGFENLAFTDYSPYQGFARFVSPLESSTSRSDLLASISIFSLQGHPEFTADIVEEIIKVREERGVFSSRFAQQSTEDARQKQDGSDLGRTILEIVGI